MTSVAPADDERSTPNAEGADDEAAGPGNAPPEPTAAARAPAAEAAVAPGAIADPPPVRRPGAAARIAERIGTDRPRHMTGRAGAPAAPGAIPLAPGATGLAPGARRLAPGATGLAPGATGLAPGAALLPAGATPPAALATSAPPGSAPAAGDDPASAAGDEPCRRTVLDAAVCGAFTAFALFLTRGLWPDPHTRTFALNPNDQVSAEWFLAYAARMYGGDFTLITDRLNAPDGVNLLSNPSLILLGLLLAPITLALGAPVSFAIAVVANLAATAAAWYLLLARSVRLHRVAAAIGAALCGFAPGMISQSNGHPHITTQWLAPAVVWCLLRLAAASRLQPADRRRPVLLAGALLGLLAAVHLYLGEEVLLITAVGLTLYGAAYAAVAPRTIREALPTLGAGLAVAGLLATALLVYPWWLRLFGPQHVRGGVRADTGADVASLTAISPLSLAGDASSAELAGGPSEYNTFYGAPLLLVVAGIALWLSRQRPVVGACAIGAVATLAVALGPRIIVAGDRTGVPGPYALLDALPAFDAATPSRFALAAVPLFAVILAVGADTALAGPRRSRLVVPLAATAALAPIAPLPLPTAYHPPVPRYFTEGYWRSCAAGGGVLVPVPPPDPARPDSMRWAAAADVGFALPEGVFVGPYGPDGRASLGAFARPTSQLLARVADTGQPPVIGEAERALAADDVAHWGAGCLVLAAQPHEDALKSTVEQLFGPPQRVADVWVWRVGPP